MKYVNEASIVIALLAVIAGIVVIVIQSGPEALAATGFHDIALALAAGLVGVTQATTRVVDKRKDDDEDDFPSS